MRAEDFTVLEPLPPEGLEEEEAASARVGPPAAAADNRRLKGAIAGVVVGTLIGTGMVAVATRRSHHVAPGPPATAPATAPASAPAAPAYLGVAARDLSGSGVEIVRVVSGSPAAVAGLRSGDIISAVDRSPLVSAAGLTDAIRAHRPGDRIRLGINSDALSRTITVTLGSLPNG
jgi:S1-C subfamily serine protease